MEKERLRLQIQLYACLIGFGIFSVFVVYVFKAITNIVKEVEIITEIQIIKTKPARREPLLVQEEIVYQAQLYGVNADTALRIAKCESEFNPTAQNPNSSAKGIYQFLDGTWDFVGGKDVYDPVENIKMFMRWYPVNPDWWECR